MTYLVPILPTSLLLIVAGLIFILLIKGNDLPELLQSKTPLIVEIKPDVSEEEREKIIALLRNRKEVDEESITLTPREEALTVMFHDFPELSNWDTGNPFFDMVTFNFKPGLYTRENVRGIEEDLKALIGVNSIFFNEDLSDDLKKTFRTFEKGLVVVVSILLIIILFLLHNAYRMELAAEKNKIRLMELIGATPGFIKKPYMIKAIKSSTLSIVFAVIIAVILCVWLNNSILSGYKISAEQVLLTAGGIILTGLIVGVISTYIILNLYLKDIYQRF